MQSPASLPYEEPGPITILVQSSLLLLLNIVNSLLDRAIYCGLVGQVLLGVAWGTPGSKWLDSQVEHVMVQLGYIGLVLLVYHGGLSTSIPHLRANLLLSLGVAITGICVPIGLSFLLRYILDATPLQCFAAGAALCSTSLGTTFTVLATSGLMNSRLGVVLSSAAMMDDVVGLVLVQVISDLGSTISAATIVRPLAVSLAFAVCAPLVCASVVAPATAWLNACRAKKPEGWLSKGLQMPETAFVAHTLVLLGCVAGASYAGTSNLFAAYIAGAVISWWDTEVPHSISAPPATPAAGTSTRTDDVSPAVVTEHVADELGAVMATPQDNHGAARESSNAALGELTPRSSITSSVAVDAASTTERPNADSAAVTEASKEPTSGLGVYEKYYAAAVDRVLRPFFFASIGFSIPIREMFSGDVVWKGLVYTVLMIVGKVVCGGWLLRLSFRLPAGISQVLKTLRSKLNRMWCMPEKAKSAQPSEPAREASADRSPDHRAPAGVKPRSVYPASIIGCAMTARGEIGFLISSIAESKGIFGDTKPDANSKLFLVATWAIVLCTIIGPLTVGFLVQRVKRLQLGVERRGARVQRDVLGVWGVQ